MTRKFWNWVRNEEPDSFGFDRTLYLDGEISDETWFGDEVTPKLFSDELHAGDGNITLWINSPGGDVFAAAQIYNMLMDYPHDVTVKIDALAASAASVIAMAGTKVCMSPVAMMMVHNPATIAIGDTEEMQKAIDMLNEVKESIMNAYEIKSGLSRHKISQLMDAETWMNAKEAVKLGFADEILFRDGEKSVPEDTADAEMLFKFMRSIQEKYKNRFATLFVDDGYSLYRYCFNDASIVYNDISKIAQEVFIRTEYEIE